MTKENLYQLIRRGEAILWAGAGLSAYAGYPSGKQLRDILLSEFPIDDSRVDANSSLLDIADVITKNRYSRNHLIRTITRILEAEPTDLSLHLDVAKIPHFRTIVTTNYDKLFETVYQNNLKVVIQSADVAYLDSKRVELFKIHGCISKPDSIIITKADYNRFFQKNTDDTLHWTVLKERMITRPIVFVGYGLGDDNINVVLDRVLEDLGDHHREIVVIAPGWSMPEQLDLARRGIIYFDLDGRSFFDELLLNIKENIYTDYKSNTVSFELFEQFVSNFGLALQVSNVMGAKQASIIPRSDSRVQVKFNTDASTGQILDDYISKNSLTRLHIQGDHIKNFKLSFNGILVPEPVRELLVTPAPVTEILGTLRLKSGLEFENLKFVVYSNPNETRINFSLHKLDITLLFKETYFLPKERGSVNFFIECSHDDVCGTIKQEIDSFDFLTRIALGETFEFFKDDSKLFDGGLSKQPPGLDTWKAYFELFSMLDRIQKYYSISFGKINYTHLSPNIWDDAYFLSKIIDEQEVTQEWVDKIPCWVGNDSDFIATPSSPIRLERELYLFGSKRETKGILGRVVDLGYATIAIHNPVLTFEYIDPTQLWPNRHTIHSETGKRTISFSQESQASSDVDAGGFSVLYHGPDIV